MTINSQLIVTERLQEYCLTASNRFCHHAVSLLSFWILHPTSRHLPPDNSWRTCLSDDWSWALEMCLNITTSQQYGGETSSNYNQNYNLSFNCDEISQKSFNTLDNENDHIPPTRGVATDHKLFFNIRNIFWTVKQQQQVPCPCSVAKHLSSLLDNQ